jgi:tetratricopeptide (TPR) repeat protein
LILCVLCLVVHANTLTNGFVWDDDILIVRNESIRSLDNIPKMFSSSLWSFAGASMANNRYYRPLLSTVFAVVYKIAGLKPFAYHLTNLLLHLLVTLMVYALCVELRLFDSRALLPAALFAVNPVHTEVVAWIGGIGELLFGLFYITALWAFLRYWNVRRIYWLGLSIAAFFLDLLSKESAVTLPFAAMLLLLMKRDELQVSFKQKVLSIVPYFGVFGLYGVLRLWVVGSSLPSTVHTEAGFFDWITLGVWMFGRYLRYAFVPHPLTAFHLIPLHLADRIASTAAYALLILAAAALLYFMRHKVRAGFYLAGLFALTLAPVFYFRGITGGFIFAERYLYVPTVPAMILLALLCLQVPRDFLVGAVTILVAAASFATVLQNRVWRSDLTLFDHSAAVYPENTYAWVNLGGFYLNAGDDTEAQRAFENAGKHLDDERFMQPQGTRYLAELGLGTMAAKRGQAQEAIMHLEKALALNPTGVNAYTVLAGVLINLEKRFDAAIPLLEKAIELNPVDDQARDTLGVALFQQGKFSEAAERFREAIRINPRSQLARLHLAATLKRQAN